MHDARASVSSQIDALNDSIAAAAVGGRETVDWARTDANGDSWGISADAIHLGKTDIPLRVCTAGPCQGSIYSVPPGRRDEFNGRLRAYQEIQQQVGRAQVRKSIDDRIRAIRGRAGAKRDTIRFPGE